MLGVHLLLEATITHVVPATFFIICFVAGIQCIVIKYAELVHIHLLVSAFPSTQVAIRDADTG